jgi:hypothetical protein
LQLPGIDRQDADALARHTARFGTALGTGHTKHVTQHLQQRSTCVDIHAARCPIDLKRESHQCLAAITWTLQNSLSPSSPNSTPMPEFL